MNARIAPTTPHLPRHPAPGNRQAWTRLLAAMAAPVSLLLLGILFHR